MLLSIIFSWVGASVSSYTQFAGNELIDKTLGIVGLGAIG